MTSGTWPGEYEGTDSPPTYIPCQEETMSCTEEACESDQNLHTCAYIYI